MGQTITVPLSALQPADVSTTIRSGGPSMTPDELNATEAKYRSAPQSITQGAAQLPATPPVGQSQWGTRADGSAKGDGFLGVLPRPDGTVSSEISIGVNIDGKEVEIPTLVPTLSQQERDWLINNDVSDPSKIPPAIIQKAVDFARPRIKAGKSPFAGPDESPKTLTVPLSALKAAPPPDTTATEPPEVEPPDLLEKLGKGWAALNKPLIPQIQTAAKAVADTIDSPSLTRGEWTATLEGLGAGLVEGAGDVAASFTSPLGIALTLAGLGPQSKIAQKFPAIQKLLNQPAVKALQTATQATAGAGITAEGAKNVATGDTLTEKAFGVAQVAGGLAGVTASAQRARAMMPSRTARASNSTILPDLMKALPPSKSASWQPDDWRRAAPHILDQHAQTPIVSVENFRDAADAAIGKIEDHVRAGVAANPNDLIRNSPLDEVRNGMRGRARADDLKIGLEELKSLRLDKPLTLGEAEVARQRLNAENNATLRKNNYDRYTARTSDPAFAARELAAEALRDGIYDQLEARGMKGVRELRRDEGSVIRLRNAAESKIYSGEGKVGGTGNDSATRRAASKVLVAGATGAGGMVAGVPGAVAAGAIAHETIPGLLSKPNMTRNALMERAFKKAVPVPNPFPQLPTAPPIAGLLTAGATPLPAAATGPTMTVTQVPWSAYPPGTRKALPAPARVMPAAPDPSYVRGVPAEIARRRVAGALPPHREAIVTPPPADPSYVKGVPAEYAKREAQTPPRPVEGRADVQRADLPQQGILPAAKRPDGAETRRLETERIEAVKKQQREEIARASALDDEIPRDEITPHETTLDSLVAEAQKKGATADPALLRADLEERLQVIKEMDDEVRASGRNPETLLKAIAKYGGISIKNETGLKGELKWLLEHQDTPGRGIPRGTMRGIRGVIKVTGDGLSVDDMLRRLSQDHQFSHIRTLSDLLGEIRGAATARGDHRAIMERLQKGLGDRWFDSVGTHVEDIEFGEP
jgi:hypothetical protein